MSTLVADLAEMLKEIPAGVWVAISERQRKAIAFGADARSVLNEARGKGERLPLMLHMPLTDSAMAA